ncbi:MAG: T9SS type A sorting domain-containing protein [Flavobacteriales bacterium]|nr:T9SS type A sorting domain-containing protein [Flavobacteriales bacterium]
MEKLLNPFIFDFKYKKIAVVMLFCFGVGTLSAQKETVASGGDATGIGGTSSYSVGQVVYTTDTGTNGSVAKGVQQPYDISITTGVTETTISLTLSVYPNPTTNYLTLKIEEAYKSASYQLIDLQGKVIKSNKVDGDETTIKMEGLPTSIYFLSISDNNQLIKTFKIIKN